MTVSKTARFAVRPSDLSVATSAVEEFVARIEATEPGTLLYATFMSGADPIDFLHVMVFSDETAETAHRSSDAVGRFTDVLYPVTIDGVRFDDQDLLATTSLRG